MVGILEFQQPKQGACRDLRELEYISALHQSGECLRSDGSVTAGDICHALLSRHGIEVDPKAFVASGLLGDLAGEGLLDRPRGKGTTGPPNDRLGLAQLVALLVIPKLKHMTEQEQEQPEKSQGTSVDDGGEAIETVLELLRRRLGLSDYDPPPPIDGELLKILFADGDDDDVCPEGLARMVSHAGPNAVLDAPTLLRLLTQDLAAYDTSRETSRTTHSDDFLAMVEGGYEQAMKGCSAGKCPASSGVVVVDAEATPATGTEPSCTMRRLGALNTLSMIDLAADTFTYDGYFILLFLSMILTYISYVSSSGLGEPSKPCGDSFGCEVGTAVASWLFVFAQLGIAGSVYIFLCSAGNSSFKACPRFMNIVAIGVLVVITILPYWGITEPFTAMTDADYLRIAIYATIGVGFLLIVQQLVFAWATFSPELHQRLHERSLIVKKELHTKSAQVYKVDRLLEHALELHRGEATADHGVSTTLRTAGESSRVFDRATSSAMVAFQSKQNDMETVGGYKWTWEAWRAGHCSQEGIWLGARFLAAQVGQILAVVIFFSLLAVSLRSVRADDDTAGVTGTSSLYATSSGGPRALYFNATGGVLLSLDEASDEDFLERNGLQFAYTFDEDESQMVMYQQTAKERLLGSLLVAFSAIQETSTILGFEAAEELFDKLSSTIERVAGIDIEDLAGYVEAYARFDGSLVGFVVEEGKKRVQQKDVKAALWFGGAMGLVSILSTTLVFFPSYICQTLQYRYGAKGNLLTSPEFRNQRQGPWNVTALFGTVFWSSLCSAVVVGSVFGGTLFLFIWEETSSYFLASLAAGIGLFSTWILKKIILVLVKNRSYSGLYRTNLGLSNYVTVFLEAWNVGLTLGFVVARSIKMLLMTCVYIGRIDTSFLASHVNFFGLGIDEDYEAFHIDLLLHEAHRHPYLERLVMLYMVKIYHGKAFASREGSSWRVLFVSTLMPWLRRQEASPGTKDGLDPLLESEPSVEDLLLEPELSVEDK